MNEDAEAEVLEAPEVEEQHAGPTPEEALAEARQMLADSEAARQAAEQRAQQAGGQAANAQEAALREAIVSTEAALAQARANYRTAREAGDLDAEQQASENASMARLRLEALKGEQQQRRAAPQIQQQASPIPGPAAQRWLAEHPKVNTDPVYAAACSEAHYRAVQRFESESPEYFRFCEAELRARFGDNHGKDEPVTTPPKQQPQAAAPRQQAKPPASSYATPPGRGNQTNARGDGDINAIAAKLGTDADTLREFAGVNGMTVDQYVKKQAEILSERNTQITYGDGAVFR